MVAHVLSTILRSHLTLRLQDQHLIVWMRIASMPHFRKLWGRIDTLLQPGDVVQVQIANNYDTYR